MNFVEKLTKDTEKGDWDYCWKYSDGAMSYTFNKPKHYLSGLNFSLNDLRTMVFPNGFVIYYDIGLMDNLSEAIDISLARTVDEMVNLYMAGEELTPEQEAAQAEQEKEKKKKTIASPKPKEEK